MTKILLNNRPNSRPCWRGDLFLPGTNLEMFENFISTCLALQYGQLGSLFHTDEQLTKFSKIRTLAAWNQKNRTNLVQLHLSIATKVAFLNLQKWDWTWFRRATKYHKARVLCIHTSNTFPKLFRKQNSKNTKQINKSKMQPRMEW